MIFLSKSYQTLMTGKIYDIKLSKGLLIKPLTNYFQVSFAPFAPLVANHISSLSKNPSAAAGVSGILDEQFAAVCSTTSVNSLTCKLTS